MVDIDQLIQAYLDGQIDPAGLERLEAWIAESDANTHRFVQWMSDHQECRNYLIGGERLDLLSLALETESEQEASLSLSALREIERRSEKPKLVDLTRVLAEQEAEARSRFEVSSDQAQGIRRVIVVPRWLVWAGAAAAVLALMALVTVPFGRPWDNGVVDTAGDTAVKPVPSQERPIAPVVAHMITSTDTVWRDAPAAGALREGQVLELLEGSAELQFNSAARVRIAAGTRLALTGENTCELQTGVLAGVCPPGAEGFEVGVPGGLVRDLGTEFTVEIGGDGLSQVLVTTGSVEIAAVALDGSRTREVGLLPGMIGQIDPGAGVVRVTQAQRLSLLNSGERRRPGDRDGNWLVTDVSTNPDYGIAPSVVLDLDAVGPAGLVPWPANTEVSGWIGVAGQGGNVPEGQVTTFLYGFHIPEGAALDGLVLEASVWADDSIDEIRINGETVMEREDPALKAVHYLQSVPIPLAGAWVQGENQIEFLVRNKTGEPHAAHLSGLRVQFKPVSIDVTQVYRSSTAAPPGGAGR